MHNIDHTSLKIKLEIMLHCVALPWDMKTGLPHAHREPSFRVSG